ncbi:hypothetical protein BJ944DRAFT_284763 [Cunninghamella echinulata]|nr:hypothetical protein BJ944DRAFT_284763 [Cunninghamella echinulata]
MVFPTGSYSTKINNKLNTKNKSTYRPPKVGPRHAPNIYDRIAAYDRAFQRCMTMDSKLSSWRLRMEQKGLPQPLLEGYKYTKKSYTNNNNNTTTTTPISNTNTINNYNNPIHSTFDIPTPKPSSPKPNSNKNIKQGPFYISSPILINTTPLPPLPPPPPPPPHKIFNRSSSLSPPSSTSTSPKTTSQDRRKLYLASRSSLIVPTHCALDDKLLQKRHSDVLSHYRQQQHWQ